MGPEQGNKDRDACQMAHFPCNGVLHLALQDGHLHCALNHSLDHVCYQDIRVPEEHCDFIMDNHKLRPTIVSVPCFI